jgi:hypothetical protein
VETDLSGTRKLDVLMYETPEFDPDLDPIMQQFGNVIFKLRAGQPFWYEDDAVVSFTGGGGTSAGTVLAENPTDQPCYQKWVLTQGTWTLPDFQIQGPKGARAPSGPNANRTVGPITITAANGGGVVDLDGQNLMFRDANNTNLMGQMAGKFMIYEIPPYTPQIELPVSGTGGMAQLIMPRHWSRPWGLELPGAEGAAPTPLTAGFTGGPFSYQMPPFCDTVDWILLGGGGGSNATGAGVITTKRGGGAGQWLAGTLHRGTDIPWSTTTLTGMVGAGGPAATDGQPTTLTWSGGPTYSAPGGTANSAPDAGGQSPGTYTYNGQDYPGGARQPGMLGAPGNPPGGGGAVGIGLVTGGAGAAGAVWFYAYSLSAGS